MTNSEDSDQTTPWGAVWSGSSLCVGPIFPNAYVFTVYNALKNLHNILREEYFDMVSEG